MGLDFAVSPCSQQDLRKNVGEYPLGRNMRFVTSILDKRFITTDATRKEVKNSVRKQRLFRTHVSSAISYIILDLDYFDSTICKTLHQALMQMRSKQSHSHNLFVAVNPSWNGSFASFLFKKDLGGEVNGILPALPPTGPTAQNGCKHLDLVQR
jgi:hypothetical protein